MINHHLVTPYRAVLIDLDGTLIEFARDYASFAKGLAFQFAPHQPQAFLKEYHDRIVSDGSVTFADSIRDSLDVLGIQKTRSLDESLEVAIDGYARGIERMGHTTEFLQRIAHKAKAIVSNGPSDMQRAAIAAAGLQDEFQAIVVSGDSDVAVRKPNPEIFYIACRRLGCEPYEAVMIGDNVNADIQGARSAGISAIHIDDLVMNL